MTQPEDARRMRDAADRLTGTYYCHSGKHVVSASIASTVRKHRRVCANCQVRIAAQRKLKP